MVKRKKQASKTLTLCNRPLGHTHTHRHTHTYDKIHTRVRALSQLLTVQFNILLTLAMAMLKTHVKITYSHSSLQDTTHH